MQTGAGTSTGSPVGLMAKLRGVFPMVGYSFLSWSVPLAGLMEKAEMVSMPARLEAYRNLPDGCTTISAASFGPLKSFRSVERAETVCSGESEPLLAL